MQVLTQTDIEASLPIERVDSYTLRAVQSTDHLFHRRRGGEQGDTVDGAGTGQRERRRERKRERRRVNGHLQKSHLQPLHAGPYRVHMYLSIALNSLTYHLSSRDSHSPSRNSGPRP